MEYFYLQLGAVEYFYLQLGAVYMYAEALCILK
jgi:hypothetical protein